MKKLLFSTIASILVLLCISTCTYAAEISLFSPSVAESEIMPTRDFYVIGTINRQGKSAASMPLNIKIELFDTDNNLIRSLQSRVAPNGVTSGEYIMTDYEHGVFSNDDKGLNILSFTPPDAMSDGTNRDSIRSDHTKIVVKENYFAAVIYGGATKKFDLKYENAQEMPVKDITAGQYILSVTALDMNNDEVCSYKQALNFDNTHTRIITSNDSLAEGYAQENNITVSSVIPGRWVPSAFLNGTNGFTYTIYPRLQGNTAAEYSNAKKVNVLLYNLNLNDALINHKLGALFNGDAEIEYLYYNIGENNITHSFDGATLVREGTIVKHPDEKFVEVLRAETYHDEDTYIDFEPDDGFVVTKGVTTNFYGVYSPIDASASYSGELYKITDKVSKLRLEAINEAGETVYENEYDPHLIREDCNYTSRFEFCFSLIPNGEMASAKQLYMQLSLIDSKGDVLHTGRKIALRVNRNGRFIDGFDDTYWGKNFCNVINNLGQSPNETAIHPDEFITRGDFAAMINRLFGYSVTNARGFSDIESDSAFFTDCLTAQATGYMTGDENGKISAEEFISREQAMIILARISKAEKGEVSAFFKDRDKISFWAEDYVDIMVSNGIVTGFDGYLHPTDSITVAEAAALIIKTVKWLYNNGEISISNETISSDDSSDISDVELSDAEFIANVNYDNISKFFLSNKDAFISVANYIQRNCLKGAYINKVGNGLEMRDYALGSFITLSDNAINLITQISSKFVLFSIKYNPYSENAVHFALGENEEGKSIGLTYTPLESVKNKDLTHIEGNWHYYIQN